MRRYATALALCVLFLGLVLLLEWLEGVRLSSVAVLSVVLSALYGGLGPALLAALVSALAIDYYFAAPLLQMLDSWSSVVRIATYACIGALVAGIVSALRAAYRDLHAQYRQIEQAKRAREQVMALVSHELRSPLSAVLLGVASMQRAAREGTAPPRSGGALEAIHRAAASMKRLVDDLLDAAGIEAGHFSIERTRQDLQPILEEAVQVARLSAGAKDVGLELSMGAERPCVLGDRARLVQVFANLIGNAIKFSPEGSRVGVSVQASADWIEVEVEDSGPGISEQDLPHIFSPYWQGADTAHLGSGLGLFVVRTIVDAHGGLVEARSPPGGGARFRVSLPRN